uniref:PAS domain S-box protein n=1 Tax=uncultured Sunxiuqinia sp. TaxID=1573825 RepID=UPI0030D91867
MKKEDDARGQEKKHDELFRNLFEFHTAIQLIIDPETGRIIDANRAAADFYRSSKDRLKEMSIQDLTPDSPEKIKKWLEQAEKNELKQVDLKKRLADGSLRDVEIFFSPIELNGS